MSRIPSSCGFRRRPPRCQCSKTRTVTLVSDPGGCRWINQVDDPEGLALGIVEAASVSYLLHPEHGGSGIAPGRYVVRRQQERSAAVGRRRDLFIAD